MTDPRSVILYLRLSLEDGEDGESDSIRSQRAILRDWLTRHPELNRQPVLELADDGWSGTTLNRPGINRLLDLVRRGQVACVLVKDLSRFGRCYREVGFCLEQVFPARRVRFVSVTEGYDSAGPQGPSADLGVALSTLLHDLYSRDISRKVRGSRQTLARRRACLSPFAPYGYRKGPSDPHRLAVDPPAAAVVRRIVEETLAGAGSADLARALNEEQIPTPLRYRQITEGLPPDEHLFWTTDTIGGILRNPVYLGQITHGKQAVKRVGSRQRTRQSPETWISVPDCHPPLMTPEEFHHIQALRQRGKPASKKASRSLFPRLLRCAGCGRILERNHATRPGYLCRSVRVRPSPACIRDPLSEETLADAVLRFFRALLHILPDLETFLRKQRSSREQNRTDLQTRLEALKRQRASMPGRNLEAFALVRQGLLTASAWEDLLARRRREKEELDRRIHDLAERITRLEREPDPCSRLETFLAAPVLTPALTALLLKEVTVHSPNRLTLRWAFRCPRALSPCPNQESSLSDW